VQKKKILRAVIVDRHYSSDTSTLSGLVEEITSSNVSDHFHEEQQSILQSSTSSQHLRRTHPVPHLPPVAVAAHRLGPLLPAAQ